MQVKTHCGSANKPVQTPVISDRAGAHNPTSSDVHLFSDPATRVTTRPLLFADCEGLNGGTKDPQAVVSVSGAGRNLRRAFRRMRSHRLKIVGMKAEQRSRAWIVKDLYPRILFTFSDLVCYVTRNLRYASLSSFDSLFLLNSMHCTSTLEVIICQLLDWADAVLERSVNQPILPYAIIVVNAFESDVCESSCCLNPIEQVLTRF